MNKKGFTLIELLVVIVIIGILVAIALPNFIKIKDKAKEAEVKQNLHSIQLSVERYATDQNGNYPYFLLGGNALFNSGTVCNVPNSNYAPPPTWASRPPVQLPFDMFIMDLPASWDYGDTSWGNFTDSQAQQDLLAPFGDTCQFEGYMPKYPTNPFQTGPRKRSFGLDAFNYVRGNFACYGGDTGTIMFNTGWHSELPQLIRFNNDPNNLNDTIKLELPGNFSYHCRYSDGVTNYGHESYQATYNTGGAWPLSDFGICPLNDSADVSSLDVAGYDLTAMGSSRTKGMDIDASYMLVQWHQWRTGYVTRGQERNPHVLSGQYGTNGDYDERPISDNVPDFMIIHLSSGIDHKIEDDFRSN